MTSLNLPRSVLLGVWMKEYFIRSKDFADQLGVTPQRVNMMIRAETMPSHHHATCLRLDFYEELLLKPFDGHPGPVCCPPIFSRVAQPRAYCPEWDTNLACPDGGRHTRQ